MPEQPCPACGAQYDTTIGAKFCPKCGAALPQAAPAEAAPVESAAAVLDVTVEPEAPAPLEVSVPVDAAPLVVDVPAEPELTPVTPAPPIEPAPPVAPIAPTAPPDQVPCPHCGEMLYTTEKICWKCGNSTDSPAPESAAPVATAGAPIVSAAPVAPAPPVMPAAPVVPSAPVPPPPPAPSAVPPMSPAPGLLGPPPAPGYTPGPTGPMPSNVLSAEAQAAGYWALGLGIGSVVMCPVAGPFALWMGSRACKLGNKPMGIIGMICGGLGVLWILLLLGIAILGIIGGATQH